ncbi:MAG: glycosyltransferase [Candidatus Coproplasma sp.]
MISLVMTTYNGEKYLEEQLDSIRNQSLQPDEVLIYDDCSSDNTPDKVKSYIEKYNLSSWKFFINQSNKGYSLNFSDAMKTAKGDIIFLADQDDIWLSDKLEKMSKVMADNPEIELLASNVEPFYVGENPVAVNYEKFNSKKELIKINRLSSWLKPARPGCSMCLRKSLLTNYDKLWFKGYPHDCLLWGLAVLNGTAYLYNKTTIKFRRHDTNASSRAEKKSNSRIQSIEREIEIIEKMLLNVKCVAPTHVKLIEKQQKLYKKRVCYLQKRSFFGVLSLMFKLKYYPRNRFYLTDLYYVIKK